MLMKYAERRTAKDLVFWNMYAQPTCQVYPVRVCPTPVSSLRVARTNQDNCDMTSLGLYDTNGCFQIITLDDGTWYVMNDCSHTVAWITGKPGAYVGTLLTYNDKPVGKCYYISHTRKFPIYPGFDQVFLDPLVRCTVT
jgi:hypothetical protein